MRLPKPKISDWAITFVSIALLGASQVIGATSSGQLEVWLFWAGVAGFGGLLLWHVFAWVWNLFVRDQPSESDGRVDNRGGIFAAGDISGSHTIINAPVTVHAPAPVSISHFDEVQRINSLIGGKDEMQLRQLFDFPRLVDRNIEVQKIRYDFIKRGEQARFFYADYTEGNGNHVVNIQKYETTEQGVRIISEPRDVIIVVTTDKHQKGVADLTKLENSALVPSAIASALKEFHDIINKDVSLLIDVLNECSHKTDRYFRQNNSEGSRFFRAVNNIFATRFIPLKPGADAVIEAIKIHWKINESR